MARLTCEACGFSQSAPEHCGRPMKQRTRGWLRKKTILVCQNEKCGHAMDNPIHCDRPMKMVE